LNSEENALISTLVTIFVILVIASLLWYGLSALPLPPVVKIVAQVLVSIIMVLFLWHAFGGGNVNTGLRLN
jgi:hypothetical protein